MLNLISVLLQALLYLGGSGFVGAGGEEPKKNHHKYGKILLFFETFFEKFLCKCLRLENRYLIQEVLLFCIWYSQSQKSCLDYDKTVRWLQRLK